MNIKETINYIQGAFPYNSKYYDTFDIILEKHDIKQEDINLLNASIVSQFYYEFLSIQSNIDDKSLLNLIKEILKITKIYHDKKKSFEKYNKLILSLINDSNFVDENNRLYDTILELGINSPYYCKDKKYLSVHMNKYGEILLNTLNQYEDNLDELLIM